MRVGFVFTNFNNSTCTINLVKSITNNNSDFENYEIIIVDNNSIIEERQSLIKFVSSFNKVKLILNNENLGYFRGLNIGINFIRNQKEPFDIILIGNNDLIFPNDFFIKLSKSEYLFKRFLVISPNIISLDGVHQNPHAIKNPSIIRELIFDLYYSNYIIAKIILLLSKKTERFTARTDFRENEIPQTILQGYGACYLLGPMFFQNFSNLWAPTFLMGEELFLSKQLASVNAKIFYEPLIIVYHHDHASIKKIPKKEFWRISKQAHKEYRKIININKLRSFIGSIR